MRMRNSGPELNTSLSMRDEDYSLFQMKFKEVKSLTSFILGQFSVLKVVFLNVVQLRSGDGHIAPAQCQEMETRAGKVWHKPNEYGKFNLTI